MLIAIVVKASAHQNNKKHGTMVMQMIPKVATIDP